VKKHNAGKISLYVPTYVQSVNFSLHLKFEKYM
jgi:hypothetical protein